MISVIKFNVLDNLCSVTLPTVRNVIMCYRPEMIHVSNLKELQTLFQALNWKHQILVFYASNGLEVSIALFPTTKFLWDFYMRLEENAENIRCNKYWT